jgi:hypothetical protein
MRRILRFRPSGPHGLEYLNEHTRPRCLRSDLTSSMYLFRFISSDLRRQPTIFINRLRRTLPD